MMENKENLQEIDFNTSNNLLQSDSNQQIESQVQPLSNIENDIIVQQQSPIQ